MAALEKSVPRLRVALLIAKVPAPESVPPLWLKVPPLMARAWPLAMVMAPVLVKLGLVPDWLTVRSPPLTLMVPSLVCWAEAALRTSGPLVVSVPWLSSWAVR